MKNFGVEIFLEKNFNVIYKNSLIFPPKAGAPRAQIFDFYVLIFL